MIRMRERREFSLSDIYGIFDEQYVKFVRIQNEVVIFPGSMSHASAAEQSWKGQEVDDAGYIDARFGIYPTFYVRDYADSLGIGPLEVGDKRDDTIELIEEKLQGVRINGSLIKVSCQ